MAKFSVSAQLNSAKEVMDDSCTHGHLISQVIFCFWSSVLAGRLSYTYYLDRPTTRRIVGDIRRVELPDVLDVEGNQTCPKLVTDDTQACSRGVRS